MLRDTDFYTEKIKTGRQGVAETNTATYQLNVSTRIRIHVMLSIACEE